nr:O-acetyltransferase OatA [uncultured bacterium]
MRRIPQLDGLRALAFLAVFANHSVYLPMAWVGVDLFFALSGFLITTILVDANEKAIGRYFSDFYGRRVRRILPAYFIVLAGVAAFVPGVNWRAIWWHYFVFGQNVSSAYQLGTGVLNAYWSLAVEEQYYFVWPILCFVLTRRQLAYACSFFLVAAPLLRWIFTPSVPYYTVIFCLTPFRIDQLAAGSLVALVWASKRDAIDHLRPFVVGVAGLSAAVFFGLALRFSWWRATANSVAFNVVGYSLSVVMCTSLLLVALTSATTFIGRLLANKWLMRVGTVSYMAYLLHEPVLHFTLGFGRLLGSTLGLGITLALAALSWRFIEAPLLQRQTSARPLPAAAP